MKIHSIEVETDLTSRAVYSVEVDTDLGRRVVKLSAPINVNPHGDMPPSFRSLTDLLWNVMREVAQGSSLSAPKVEA